MSAQGELRKTIIEALAVAQSDADTDCPIVADIRRQLADAELTSQRLHAGLITREQAALLVVHRGPRPVRSRKISLVEKF